MRTYIITLALGTLALMAGTLGTLASASTGTQTSACDEQAQALGAGWACYYYHAHAGTHSAALASIEQE